MDVPADIQVENIGGITEASATFPPGVTVLTGRNATNRTSLLRAIKAACGSDDVSLKADADEGQVELAIGDETYTRTLSRRNGTTALAGDPYLSDVTEAELFAFLFENNEARRAVVRGDDLREVIMRPVDTTEIQREIDRITSDREEIESEIDEIDEAADRLPALEEERTDLDAQIEETRAELEAVEQKLEEADADLEETQDEKSKLDERLEDLKRHRSALDSVRYDLETERESLSALRTEEAELEESLEEMPAAPSEEASEIERRVRELRDREERLEARLTDVQSIVQFNEEMLDEDGAPAVALDTDGGTAAGDDPLTDQLVEEGSVTCWTCGSEVQRDRIQSTVDRLRAVSRDLVSEANGVRDEIDELTDERRRLDGIEREREQCERRLATVRREIEESEESIEDLEARREELTETIAETEEAVEALEDDNSSELLELNKEANQLEYELGRLDGQLDRIQTEIEEIEDQQERRDGLVERRDEIQADLERVRTRIERLEQDAIEEFNEEMEHVLDMLGYQNLERIWLERVQTERQQGRGTIEDNAFTLHVVRTTDSGAAYEDTIDHLSESEREITGLVFALAGYLAHDVATDVPFMLLDSMEAFDSDRIATIVEHFSQHAPYLVVALLPEDAAALPDEYTHIEHPAP